MSIPGSSRVRIAHNWSPSKRGGVALLPAAANLLPEMLDQNKKGDWFDAAIPAEKTWLSRVKQPFNGITAIFRQNKKMSNMKRAKLSLRKPATEANPDEVEEPTEIIYESNLKIYL